MFFSTVNLTFVLCCNWKAENLINKKLSKNPNYQICGKEGVLWLSEDGVEVLVLFLSALVFLKQEREALCATCVVVSSAKHTTTETTQQNKESERTENSNIPNDNSKLAGIVWSSPPPFRASYTSPESFRSSTKLKIAIFKIETLYVISNIRKLS